MSNARGAGSWDHESVLDDNQNPVPCQLVKVGGSLLDRSDLAPLFWRWYRAQRASRMLLVAGGGRWVDAIRAEQRRIGWSDARAHHLALQAMGVTAQVLAFRLGLTVWSPDTNSGGELGQKAWPAGAEETCGEARFAGPVRVVRVGRLLRQWEPHAPGLHLGVGWNVTSDSIAARLAALLSAQRLVLLKSASPPAGGPDEWAAAGYADSDFPLHAAELPEVVACELTPARTLTQT